MKERRKLDRRTNSNANPITQALAVFLAGLVVVICVLVVAHPVIFALAVSLALYALLSPAVEFLQCRGWDIVKAAGAVMGMATVALVFVSMLLYPLLIVQINAISVQVGSLDERLLMALNNVNLVLTSHTSASIDAVQLSHSIIQQVSEDGVSLVHNMSMFFSGIAPSLLLIPLVTFFLLCDFIILRNKTMQLLPNRHFELGWLVYNRAASQLQSYIRGVSIQAMIMATVTTVGFWLAGIDYAPLLGVMVGMLNMIPFFGISLAKVPPVVAVLISSDPSITHIALAFGVVIIAQMLDNSFVIPRIVAKAASLHPLTVMIGVMLGGYYFGFFGLILIIPVMFSFKVIYGELLCGLQHQAINLRTDAQRQSRQVASR